MPRTRRLSSSDIITAIRRCRLRQPVGNRHKVDPTKLLSPLAKAVKGILCDRNFWFFGLSKFKRLSSPNLDRD